MISDSRKYDPNPSTVIYRTVNDQIKASSFNQHLQVELLSIYGANPSAINDDGKLPEDVAREKGHDHLHIRLLEIKFEVSGNDL